MYCNYCRSLNPNNAVYCSACGRTIRMPLEKNENQAEVGNVAEAPSIVAPAPATVHQDDEQTGPNMNPGEGRDTQRMASPPIPVPASASEQQKRTEYLPTPVVEGAQAGESGVPSSPTKLDSRSLVPVYGSMGRRFTAYFADVIVIYFIVFLFYVVTIALKLPITANEGESQLVWLGTLFVYMVVAQAAYHTTIGKYVHGLEVCSAKPNRKYPAFWRILLRESLGRLFSSFFWGLGYWTAAWKPRSQAWSDELAGTVVTVRPTNRVLVRALTAFVLVAFFLDVGMTGYGFYKEDRGKQYAALEREMDAASKEVIAAHQSVDNRLNSAPTVSTWDDFSTWQEVMESLKGDLDKYEGKIDHIQGLINKGISEDITASKAERNQLVLLRQVYELRKQQAEIYRQEANLVVSCERKQSAVDSLRNDLQLLDSDIKGLENQASRLLAEIKTK